MKLIKLLIISLLSMGSAFGTSYAFTTGCDLNVSTEVKHATKGKSDGEVMFSIENYQASRHKIFLLNKGSDVARREVKDLKVGGLKEGYYDFVVIDTKGDRCVKDLTVVIKEN